MRKYLLLALLLAMSACAPGVPTVSAHDPIWPLQPDPMQPADVPQ